MKLNIILAILLIIIGGCSTAQKTTISGTQELMLNEQDIQQIGLTSDFNSEDLQQLGISNGTNCRTDGDYTNIIDSSQGQYSVCIYNINSLDNTSVIIELQKFANYEALNGSYQYQSNHLFSVQGIISTNKYGDQSLLRVNNENDYMGNLNPPDIYYYHLWITKDLYLIHITSSGSKDTEDYIVKIGQQILSKFGK